MAEIEYPQSRLQDDLIALRPPREPDVEAVTVACQDPLVARFTLVPAPYSEDDAREWFRDAERQRHEGTGLHFVTVDAVDDRVLAGLPGACPGRDPRRCRERRIAAGRGSGWVHS